MCQIAMRKWKKKHFKHPDIRYADAHCHCGFDFVVSDFLFGDGVFLYWRCLEVFGDFWNCLEDFGGFGKFLQVFGGFGSFWMFLQVCGSSWRILDNFEGF